MNKLVKSLNNFKIKKKFILPATFVLLIVFVVYFFWPSENSSIISKISNNLKLIAPDVSFTVSENKVSGNTFTLDKKYIFLCLNTKNINTLMYVAIHELAHIVSKNYGHDREFVENFQKLLRRAMDMGLYSYVDYSQTPEKYCNMTLNTMVLK